jgi:hypothetical protein
MAPQEKIVPTAEQFKAAKKLWIEMVGDLPTEEAVSSMASFLAAREAEIAAKEAARWRIPVKELMDVLAEELTGNPKNVPKSHWASKWDQVEALITSTSSNWLAQHARRQDAY